MGHDLAMLQRELDRTKSQVFLGNNAAFLGSLMCGLTFIWDEKTKTAATDGVSLWWNPTWFLSLCQETRKTVLVHELWHPARLHMLRQGSRDMEIWNYACDILINNNLEDERYSFKDIEWGWKDQNYSGWAEEDIYDDLISKGMKPPPQGAFGDPSGGGDMQEPSDSSKHAAINNVVKAIHQAKLAGQAGSIPGDVEKIINKFLTPVIPWETLLYAFFTDLLDEDYTWARPNRRYSDLYLPSRFTDDGRLEHLAYYLDVSGSVSDHDVLRFNSEVKYIKETLNPVKLTLVQFDTRITQERIFTENDLFDEIVVVGRGGTSLRPVRQHIIDNKPTAAVIFSDLQCAPMEPIELDIPVLWVAVNSSGASVPFGKLIHIRN